MITKYNTTHVYLNLTLTHHIHMVNAKALNTIALRSDGVDRMLSSTVDNIYTITTIILEQHYLENDANTKLRDLGQQ